MSLFGLPRLQLRLVRDPAGATSERTLRVRHAADLAQCLTGYFEDLDREHVLVVGLDTTHAVIGLNTVSIGSLTTSLVHPREVFKPLLLMNACAVILAHNHPSGDPTPSPEDLALTARLVACGDLLGIRVLDHLVFGHDRYCSLAAHGYVPIAPEHAPDTASWTTCVGGT